MKFPSLRFYFEGWGCPVATSVNSTNGLFVLVILYTILWLVPINKRIAGLNPDALPANWKQQHRHWDKLHRVRVALLTVAMAFLVWTLV